MKRNILRTIFFATLLLSLAPVAPAQYVGACSNVSAAGMWGMTETGTLVLPTGAVPVAAIGSSTVDASGNMSGTLTSSLNGTLSVDTINGTVTVNSDCTGTMTVGVYSSGKLQRTVGLAFVLDDNAREVRAIVTSVVLANGASLPPVLTLTFARMFPWFN